MKRILAASALIWSGCGRVGYAEVDSGLHDDVGMDAYLAIDAPDAARDTGADAFVAIDTPLDSNLPDGIDAGPDAGSDAGPDAGNDAAMSFPDATFDTGSDAGRDAGNDAGMDAGRDAGSDAGRDAGSDAGRDAGSDAGVDATVPDAGPIRTPIEVAPGALLATDWTHRSFIRNASEGCSLAVTYEPTLGAPDDRIQMALTGCPMNGAGRHFLEMLEWDSQDLVESRDGRICRVNASIDTSRQSSLSPNTCFTGSVGLVGTQVGTGNPLIQYTNSYIHCPSATATFPWTAGLGLFTRDGLAAAGFDFTRPMQFVLVFNVVDWATDPPDMVISYDNPRFRVVFDRDADGICDDVDPTP